MEPTDFALIRKAFKKTQKQLASLLGVSIKAVHSYEQGWRSIPVHIERQLYFLLKKINDKKNNTVPCWDRKGCSEKEHCPAYEFQCGDLCWFICGTRCAVGTESDGKKKMAACKSCEVLQDLLVSLSA
jgi:predicted transcriptional regulator